MSWVLLLSNKNYGKTFFLLSNKMCTLLVVNDTLLTTPVRAVQSLILSCQRVLEEVECKNFSKTTSSTRAKIKESHEQGNTERDKMAKPDNFKF
jgi:hypothetical protein